MIYVHSSTFGILHVIHLSEIHLGMQMVDAT